jgi:hypothetical protein
MVAEFENSDADTETLNQLALIAEAQRLSRNHWFETDTRPLTLPPKWAPPPAHHECNRCTKRNRRVRLYRIIASVMVTLALIAGTTTLMVNRANRVDLSTPAGSALYEWPHGHAPVGIVFSDLQNYVINYHLIQFMEHKIGAARFNWRANTIRIQILQDRLVYPDSSVNGYYFWALKQVVHYAIGIGLKVVLNAQTEQSTGWDQDEQQPTARTIRFWKVIDSAYQDNPHVIYDLFNEPRKCSWGAWLNGGYNRDTGLHYVGMQALVTDIRDRNTDNVIWVEGRNWASTLEGVPMLKQPAGFPRIVYTYHHPGSTSARNAPANPALWWQTGLYLAARGIPVVDAEFAQYIGNYHWQNPAYMVPKYFAELTKYHVGIMAWTLVPGALTAGAGYRQCASLPQSDGCLIKAFFGKTSNFHPIAYLYNKAHPHYRHHRKVVQ